VGRLPIRPILPRTFALPAGSNPQGISSGPFGQLYFAEPGLNQIGSITTAGTVTLLVVGQIAAGSQLIDVVAGGSHALWFTESGSNTVGRSAGLSPEERAVQALYIDDLSRAGSVAELDGWVSQLEGTALTPVVVSGIEGSPEARDRLVKSWYATYLGRQAQSGEESTFANQLLAGATEEQVLSQILGDPVSHEFFNRAQSLIGGSDANSNYVQALYQLLLGRTGSAAEVASWVSDLQSGVTREQVAQDFLSSTESRTDVVAGYYVRLLHRAGDPFEISDWVNTGFDEFHIRVDIQSSAEHSALIVSTDYFSGPPADLVTGSQPTFASPSTINDLYAFVSPSNANNTVLIFNFQPFPGVLTPSTADPTQTYTIHHVNNTSPLDGSDNLDFQVTYGTPNANGVQSVTLTGPANTVLAQGLTGQNISILGGGTFRSGIQDEPGFFDAGAFSNYLATGDKTNFPRPVGQAKDFYGPGGNTFSIIIEIPSTVLTPVPNGIIGVWATISKNGTQISRMGRPLIDTLLIPPVPRNNLSQGNLQAAFEAGRPSTDRAKFKAAMVAVLTDPNGYYKESAATADTISNLLLPDMLDFQVGNTAGYGTFIGSGNQYLGNGRKLGDPVVNTTLAVLTGGPSRPTTSLTTTASASRTGPWIR
jgi:hypothetical protein